MIRFSRDKVLLLHQLMIAETGGANEVRDTGLLDSALENVYATFDGQDLYPTKEEKDARLGYSLISNHAFVDGNKRIGMYVMLTSWRSTVFGWKLATKRYTKWAWASRTAAPHTKRCSIGCVRIPLDTMPYPITGCLPG